MQERSKLLWIIGLFIAAYFIPWDHEVMRRSGLEAFLMLQDYAREHVLTCLIPAFFIAGGISVFVSQAAVLKYFGAQAKKILAYSVASVSGSILAVCSCTVLPLFAGIYTRGAGIGPATAFLYSGPAINVLAIVLTARVLGWQMGLARAIGAILFALIIGLLMAFIFRKDDAARTAGQLHLPDEEDTGRRLWQDGGFMLVMVLILLSATLAPPAAGSAGVFALLFSIKWYLVIGLLGILAWMLKAWFIQEERKAWVASTWDYVKLIAPLLAIGVLAAGFFLGRPGHPALIPESWIAGLVGGNSFGANLFAALAGGLMYFATLTEIPILQGLMGSGMGKGPALALLLAGPAISLPNMLVVSGVLGVKKTAVFSLLVIVMSTAAGMFYGSFFA
ncbi:permease [Desulfobotulus sp. H1]|uniref:Permease n=1 Tax=Desulfobotulus pelophilus TaxID=2823377 RepID=A0ABT3NC44_9BACT|nr:permease [Desulfobotulus pelophilus]MCW7755036.1 permease [Desulfobotulus pelophilus]